MSRMKGIVTYCSFELILLILGSFPGCGQVLKWQGRLDLSLIQDNNVFETIDMFQADSTKPQTDNSIRMGLHLNAAVIHANPHEIRIKYSGGIEGYHRFGIENRLIQHGSLIYAWKILNHITIGMDAQARGRIFFQVNRGYQWIKGEPFVFITLPLGFKIKGHFSLSKMGYNDSDLFNYKSRMDGVMLIWYGSPKFQTFIYYQTELMKFNRTAYGWDHPTPEGRFLPKDERQSNLLRDVSVGTEWMHWLLCRIEVHYQWQVSNSYGYDYQRPWIELIAVKSLPHEWTFRAYGKYQKKKYTDSLEPFQISPLIEIEENTHVLCDLIKDISDRHSLRFRIGWYLNESPFRNLYYEKTRISIGFSHDF